VSTRYSDADLAYENSVLVSAPPLAVYALVADVTRMGEWSPICVSCWWDEGADARVGAWFTGRNVTPEQQWDTRCRVTVADPGREFSFVVAEPDVSWVSWRYTMAAEGDGTRLTESWEFLPAGVEMFYAVRGELAEGDVLNRIEAARAGIHATLATIKAVAEKARPSS
jgi:ribosome-associated toxin RatA of RatAB toxin-antitoxin module